MTGKTRWLTGWCSIWTRGRAPAFPECVEVAWALRERLGALGARTVPVTSGSKGIHVYVPLDEPITSGQASDWARLAAEQLEQALPDLVVSTMAKTARRGKVLIDWSQNNGSKTTVAPYSFAWPAAADGGRTAHLG